MFGFFKEYTVEANTLVIDEQQNSFQIAACDAYQENDKVGLIYISQLKQPMYEKATDSVRIHIDTAEGFKVAQIENGVTFTPIRGDIQASAIAANNVVSAQTMIAFEIQPKHIIYKSDSPQMVVEFPSDVQISSAQCKVEMVGMTDSTGSIAPICTRF